MSNRRAAAAVTATLSELISRAIAGWLPGAFVSNRRPGTAAGVTDKPCVNVYLYRAEPNPSLRNANDPVRSSDGRLLRQPIAAWNLNYLLTFIGSEEQLEPDLLFGATVTTLNATPTLASGLVAAVNEMLEAETGNKKNVAGSELAQQTEVVRLTPLDLSLEALAQLWSLLTRDAYTLSVAYQASVVLMSSELLPNPPLPVAAAPSLALATLLAPRITRVTEKQSSTSPILISSTLLIEGERLRADQVQVRLGTLDVDLASRDVSPTRIELQLSGLDLAPGVVGVQVRHLLPVSTATGAAALRPAATSNVAPILLRPAITDAELGEDSAGDNQIEVTMAPPAKAEWDFCLLLNEVGVSTPRGLVLADWSLDTGSNTLYFAAADVPNGDWLVRLQVNGAESPLVTNASGVFNSPKVVIA